MIEKPRFYIVGAFENGELCGVSSLDYKCGKLIGKIDFPADCNTDKLVEIGFNIVHSNHRGKGIMKLLVSHLLEKIKADGFEWAFAKVHQDNHASSKSLLKNGFEIFSDYKKPVSKEEFEALSSQPFFSAGGREKAASTLEKFKNEPEIIVNYQILTKKL
jgi:RimJ/RimL family protein N-acetyltransferase